MAYKIDPALEAALKKRGQNDKLKQMQEEAKQASTLKQLPKAAVETTQKVGDFVGLTKAADIAAGTILANPFNKNNTVSKYQREIERNSASLQSNLDRQLRAVNVPQEQKAKAAQMMARINPEIVSDMPELQHTNKDIWTEAGKLALLVTAAGSGSYQTGLRSGVLQSSKVVGALKEVEGLTKAVTYADRVRKYGKVGQAMNLAQKFGPGLAADFLAGASYGTMDAMGKNKSIEDIKKDAVLAGGVSAVAPVVLGLGLRGLGYTLRGTGKGIQGLNSNVKQRLEDYILGTTKEQRLATATDLTSQYNAIVQPAKTKGQKIASKALGVIKAVEKIPQTLFDAGAPLKSNWEAYKNYRVGADRGANAVNSQKANFVENVVNPYQAVEEKLKARMLMLDQLDRANLGNKTAIGKTAEEITKDISEHSASMLDDGSEETIQKALDAYQKFNVDRLQEMVDAGYINKQSMDKLIETHPNYIPHEVVTRTIDDALPVNINSGSMNPSKSPILKAEGSERAINDPWEATFNRLEKHYKAVEKAKLTNSVIEGMDKSSITNITNSAEIPSALTLKEQGMSSINRWKDGIKETWLVPEDVATAVKHLDDESAHPAIEWYGKVNNLMKEWVTGKSLPFGIQNLTKDRQSAYINADAFIKSAQKRLGIDANTMKSIGMDNESIVKLYGKEGGFGASIFSEYSSKTAAKSLDDMRKSGLAKVYSENSNPFKVIENINKKFEQSTRLKVFKQALESGLPPDEAVLISRDASVDFQKMGTAMKWMNKIVPFLNARVQGVSNMSKAISNDPMGVGRRLWWTTTYPQVALHSWNRQFESEKNISDNIKKNYWTIIVDEDEIVDQDGRKVKMPITVNIKKGEWQALSTLPVQMFLDNMDGKDSRKMSELMYDIVGSVSPVSTGSYNKDSWWTAPLAAMGPIPKIAIGMGTNVDPYTGLDIVKDTKAPLDKQFDKYTPELIKELAGTIGVSPARMNFFINSWGTVPKDIVGLTNIAEGAIKGEPLRSNSLSDAPMSKATKIPGLSSFLKESQYIGSRDYKNELERFQSIDTKKRGIDIDNKAKADEIIDNAFRIEDKAARKQYLMDQEKLSSKAVIDKMRSEYRSRNAEGYLRPGMDQEVVAKFVYQDIQEMQRSDVSNTEILSYLKNLEDKKIIGSTAQKEIGGYLKYGKYIDAIETTEDTFQKTDIILEAVQDMLVNKVDKKYIILFLDKNRNDGYITEETLPLINSGIKQIKSMLGEQKSN